MAEATVRATSLTTLKIGKVEVPVGLFSTVAKPGKLASFDTAGPNGGRLKAQAVARPVPVDELPGEGEEAPVASDPLGDEPVAFALDWQEAATSTGSSVPLTEEGFVSAVNAMRSPTDSEGDPVPVQAEPPEMFGIPISEDEIVNPQKFVDRLKQMEGSAAAGDEPMTWSEQPAAMMKAVAVGNVVDGEYGRELVEEGSGVVVAPQDVRRGVRLEDGRFIDCTAELARIEERTKLDRMDVLGFVDATQVTRVRVKGVQYIGAGDSAAPHALRIVYEGLKQTRRMALVKLTKRSRQTLGVIGTARGVLVLLELVWAEDFREPPARAACIRMAEVSEREVAMFTELVEAMSVPVGDLDALRDDAVALREELRAKAERGEVIAAPAEAANPVAEDLMAQLEASLAATR